MTLSQYIGGCSYGAMLCRRLLLFVLAWMTVGGSTILSAADGRRVAIVPAVADFEIQSEWRRALSGFDARVQAELLKGWQVEVLSRAGLSTVVFEQKLRAATDPKTPMHRVLPADLVVLTVFDFARKELRLYAVPVGDSMKVGNPTVLKAKSPHDLSSAVPAEAARILARIGKLTSQQPDPAAANPNAPAAAQRLVCALLEPVSPEGILDASVLGLAPLIRAGLEQAVSSGNAGAVQLVERNNMTQLINEKALKAAFGSGLDANAATQFGRMVKADLIVVPFVHAVDKAKIETDVFALEVSTGRLLECFSWSGVPGEQIPLETISGFLRKASSKARELAGHQTPDNAKARHAEAAFLASIPEQWAGLRMSTATTNQAAMRMADAALALSADDPALMVKTMQKLISQAMPLVFHQHAPAFVPNADWLLEAERLRKSGQFAALQADARRVFELPLLEMQREPSGEHNLLMAWYWNNLGEYEKALQTVGAGGKQNVGSTDDGSGYEQVARAYMGLGRYKKCTETVLQRGRFSSFAMKLMVDAFRADGDEANEFKYMWINRTKLGTEYDRDARLIDLAVKFGKTSEALEFFADGSLDWARAEPGVQLAAIRARIAAGQKEIAISDAQCALMIARKEKKGPLITELEKILASLNARPLDRLLRAGDFIRLPSDCVIHLIHDQTILPAHARAVAEHIAGFWRCPVQIWPVKLEARKLSFYKPLAEALDSVQMHRLLTEAALPAQRYLGRVFLTHEKFIATRNGNYYADVHSWSLPRLTALSEHYFAKYEHLDKRPLPLIDAIVACAIPSVKHAMWRHLQADTDIANDFAPIPPDLFSNNGRLVMDRHELGISPRTAAVLREITWEQIAVEIDRRVEEGTEQRVDPKDRPIIEDLSRQLGTIKPAIVSPPTLPATKEGKAAGR